MTAFLTLLLSAAVLAAPVADAPQLPDTLALETTDSFIGEGLVKVVVRKGVKKIRKAVQAKDSERAAHKAVYGTPSLNKLFPGKQLGSVRIATYNVGTFTKSGYDRTVMVSDMLKELKVDAAALQELDSCTTRTGGTFQLLELAESTGGMDYWFTPALDPYQNGAYGIGIISKSRMKPVCAWEMPLEKGRGSEQRALSVVEYRKLVLACTHLDNKNATARQNQAQAITDALMSRYGGTHKVVVLCGDFNDKPSSKVIRQMAKNWTVVSCNGNTYPSDKPKQCIDYIMVLDNNSSYEVRRSFVAGEFRNGKVSEASDHLPVWVDIKARRASE